ncbi:SpaA isopeptide-forming pilin-related protein [Streptococcus phocae subsp. salmonis]|uniref:SpaA isopeptide-forming pilin-related protein n=1 Tax=Streptococcus phocae TaxID=119224 RepID=UPI00068B87EE|nr:SpaA isopeptide-forming pilin-related protein [Streptococcus phocae]
MIFLKKLLFKYEWIDKDKINSVKPLEFISDNEGQFEVRGLEYGKYELEEVKAPTGYAQLTKTEPFEIKEGSYKGSEKEINYKVRNPNKKLYAQQIKNRKITIPQTGGIGTVIFTVAGLAIMAGAGYVMIRRRKHDQA